MRAKRWLYLIPVGLFVLLVILQVSIRMNRDLSLNDEELYIWKKRDLVRKSIDSSKLDHKIKVAVLGDSTLASGFLPKVFDAQDHRLYSFNAAITAQDIMRFPFILDDLIDYKFKPDYIIVNLSYERPNKNNLFNASKYEMMYFYEITGNLEFLIDYYLPALNYQRVKNLFVNMFRTRRFAKTVVEEMEEERGSYYWQEKCFSIGKDVVLSPRIKPQLDNNSSYVTYIYKFLDKCNRLDIKVLIVTSPTIENKYYALDKMPLIYSKIEQKYNNVKIFKSWSKNTYPSQYFFDDTHLNYNGAELFTKQLFKDFNNTYLRQLN